MCSSKSRRKVGRNNHQHWDSQTTTYDQRVYVYIYAWLIQCYFNFTHIIHSTGSVNSRWGVLNCSQLIRKPIPVMDCLRIVTNNYYSESDIYLRVSTIGWCQNKSSAPTHTNIVFYLRLRANTRYYAPLFVFTYIYTLSLTIQQRYLLTRASSLYPHFN